MPTANAADLNSNANIWRMVNDFWDYNGLSTLPDVFTAAGNWQGITSLTAGHWPDGDMLPLGYLGPRNEWHASGQTTFTQNEQVTIMSLWSIIPSPLIFGGNVSSLASDAWTTALLTNEEVMGVNQDSSGTHGKRVLQQGTTEVWTRDMSGGKKAVALFNRGTQDATVSATFSQLGVAGTPTVRDLWHRADVTGMTTGLSVTVPYSGALMYTLTPVSSGTGGAPSTGGAPGTGGNPNSGGAANTGGSRATGGALGTGGTRAAGGTSAAATGGSIATIGGSAATNGGAQATGGVLSTGGARSTGGAPLALTGGANGVFSGGAPSMGGATASLGGVNGVGGIAASGGAPTAGGNATTIGSSAIGGSSAANTNVTSTDAGNAENTGSCGCRVPSGRSAPLRSTWGIALLGLALVAWRRRRDHHWS